MPGGRNPPPRETEFVANFHKASDIRKANLKALESEGRTNTHGGAQSQRGLVQQARNLRSTFHRSASEPVPTMTDTAMELSSAARTSSSSATANSTRRQAASNPLRVPAPASSISTDTEEEEEQEIARPRTRRRELMDLLLEPPAGASREASADYATRKADVERLIDQILTEEREPPPIPPRNRHLTEDNENNDIEISPVHTTFRRVPLQADSRTWSRSALRI